MRAVGERVRRVWTVVRASEAGLRADAFCRARWPHDSGACRETMFREGRLTRDGLPVAPGAVLAGGERLCCELPVGPEPRTCSDYRIVYRDEDLVVVDKPANLPCHAAGRYREGTLEHLLREREGLDEVRLIHRLDRETSGLVVVATRAGSAARLGRAFLKREVRKAYLAVVEGVVPRSLQVASGWLYLARGITVRRKRVFVAVRDRPQAEEAQPVETLYRRIACRDGLSWLHVVPRTGRPHQIRATLKGCGYPVVGDKLYGLDETIYARLADDALTELDRRRLRIGRQALHAWRLEFRHPCREVLLRLTAPVPDDLGLLWGVDRPGWLDPGGVPSVSELPLADAAPAAAPAGRPAQNRDGPGAASGAGSRPSTAP